MKRAPEAFYVGVGYDFFLAFQLVQMPAKSFYSDDRNIFLNEA